MLIESFSGVRGIFGDELSLDIVSRYAFAYFSEYLSRQDKTEKIRIVIGRDTRQSGPEIFNAMLKSLNCEILDLGICPTPATENAVRAFDCDGGIMITASHNEPEFNGFKFLDKKGGMLEAEDMHRVIKRYKEIKEINLDVELSFQEVIDKHDEAIEEYYGFVKSLVGKIDGTDGFKILVDPNGGSGFIVEKLYESFGINAEYINMKPGKFAHLVEPKLESLSPLLEHLKKSKASFLVGFDCDADRAEILLSNGELLSGSHLMAIVADDILEEKKGYESAVVVNDATSYIVKEVADKHNVEYIEVEVGESNVVSSMDEYNSYVGGEGAAGGVIIPPSRCRDGMMVVLYLLRIMVKKKKGLDELIKELPKYYYLRDRIELGKDFMGIREKVIDYYLKNKYDVQKTGDDSGGLKFLKKDGWVWFRQSKTEHGVLRVIADSKVESVAKGLLAEARELLKAL